MRRRHFLAALAATTVLSPASQARPPLAAACARDGRGFAVIALDMGGKPQWRLPLPARGHGIALAPDRRQAIVFGRRPGAWAVLFDPDVGMALAQLEPPARHYFCGHGLFLDADHVVATVGRQDDGEGFLVLFARDLHWRPQRIWATGGPDPHEVIRWSGTGLVIANGGYRRDPDTPRLAEMDAEFDSSIILLDVRDGTIVQQQRAAQTLRDLSLRHLATARGQVFVATQLPRMIDPGTPMILRWTPGSAPQGLDLGAPVNTLRGYCGSIVARRDGASLGVSSPRGGVVLAFSTTGQVLGRTAMPDVCAIMARSDGFMMAGGRGDVSIPGHEVHRMDGVQWDNHMVAL